MPDRDLSPYLGQGVQVVIDRPLGTYHPRHSNICYPVNYGYLPGTVSGDGAPVDAYVLGVDVAVAAFEGIVIAVIARADDIEDKLVVVPPDKTVSRAGIAAAVAFQEQFFTAEVVMTGDASMPHPHTLDDEDIEIIVATPDDWQAARDIRLEALLRDPQAFGSTYAESIGRTEDEWRTWVSRPGVTLLLARADQAVVGIVGGLRGDDMTGDAAVAWVVSMYVTATHRQRGVGRRLLQAILADLEEDPVLTRVILHVSHSQLPAQRLYASLGFVPIGEEDGEIIMARPLR
ncbi:MAG: GNAT family N-acetyltransferase [Thermomicrobiales bacterium]|nr:GNAT family N-acetyltransferase [Thermomicrobiales bacterium]